MNPLLGRWISADPLAVHAPGEADLNLYAYVRGAVLANIDPVGLEEEPSGTGGASDELEGPQSGAEGASGVSEGANSSEGEASEFNCEEQSCVLRPAVDPGVAEKQALAKREAMTVRVASEKADLPGGDLAADLGGKYHQWIILPDGTASGQGNANGVPGDNGQSSPDVPGSQTYMVDHSGRTPAFTEEHYGVDVETLKIWLEPGQEKGPWIPFFNDCNEVAAEAIDASTPQDRMREDGTVMRNVVLHPDGSMREPLMTPAWMESSAEESTP